MPNREQDIEVGIQQKDTEHRLVIGSGVSPEARVFRDREELVKTVEALRQLHAKIVLTSGTFDLLHPGHGRYLECAKSHGDFLIVGVDSDEKVRQRKGPSRPVTGEIERVEMLSYLRSVDFITVKQADEPRWDLIKTVHPDTLIITQETYDDDIKQQLSAHCGEVVCLPPQGGESSGGKLRRIQVDAQQQIIGPFNEVLEKLETVQQESITDLRRIMGRTVLGGVHIENDGAPEKS